MFSVSCDDTVVFYMFSVSWDDTVLHVFCELWFHCITCFLWAVMTLYYMFSGDTLYQTSMSCDDTVLHVFRWHSLPDFSQLWWHCRLLYGEWLGMCCIRENVYIHSEWCEGIWYHRVLLQKVNIQIYPDKTRYWGCVGFMLGQRGRAIVGFWLVEMAISTNQKPTIYRNLYENTGPDERSTNSTSHTCWYISMSEMEPTMISCSHLLRGVD